MSNFTLFPNRTIRRILPVPTKSLAVALTTLLSIHSASAQFQVNKQAHDNLRSSRLPYPEEKISLIAKEVRSNGWVFFNESLKDAPESIASKHKDAFGLGDTDELRTTAIKEDELGITRYRYTQYHGGLPVEGADFSIYAKAGQAVSATGRLVQTLGPAQLPAVTEKAALAIALASAPAKKYLWQDKQAERGLRISRHDSTATNFPTGKLLYALSANDGNAPSTIHRLAYRFDIARMVPEAYEAIYVDAQTGQLLRINSLVQHSSCQTNRVDTWYNGTNNLSTWWESYLNGFQLRDYCRGSYILTKTSTGNSPYNWDSGGYYMTAGGSENNALNTNWNTSFEARSSASVHFGCQVAHYYFQTRFNHTGGTGNGKEFRVVANNYSNNAGYMYLNDDDYMVIGRMGNGSGNSLGELDIVAHEFTHAVVHGSANLQGYRTEASALNESFADIFAEMSELMHTGQHDWIIGRQAGVPRAFANVAPSWFLAPNPAQVYQGRDWDFNGEEHTNSGVQSRWFYLLSVGGQGDFGISVNGIGEEKAARIAYRNLTTYLGPNATYADARAGAIQAATDLYGLCSVEATATTNAWAAVGVGGGAGFCATEITGTSSFCIEAGTNVSADYRVSASPGATKFWSNSNSDFVFNALGPIDYVTLNTVPGYAASTTLQVDIQSGGVSATRYRQINTRQCRPQPCPPGIIKCPDTPITPAMPTGTTEATRVVSLYPNPSDASVTLDLATPAIAPTTIHIQDMTGRILYTHYLPVGQQKADLDVARLPVGSYLLFITSATGTTSQRLLINR